MSYKWLASWIFLLFGLLDAKSQSIVSRGKYFGLQNSAGEDITPFEYDSIFVMDDAHFYVLAKGDKNAFYFLEGNLLTPCIYDKLKANQGLFLFERDGKKGCIVKKSKSHDPEPVGAQFIEALYDEIYTLKNELLVCRTGEQFYLYSLNGKGNFENPGLVNGRPMYRDHYGMYCKEGEILTLIRNTDVLRIIRLQGRVMSSIEDFIYEKNQTDGELHIWSNATGEEFGEYRDSLNGKVVYDFREDCMCVWKTDHTQRRYQKISWLVPYGGKEFFSVEIARKAELRLSTIGTERDMNVDTEVYVYSHTNYESYVIGLGTVKGYNYSAYPEKRVEIQPYSSSSGKKPFFMPGKD
jgi:hypothetical protein